MGEIKKYIPDCCAGGKEYAEPVDAVADAAGEGVQKVALPVMGLKFMQPVTETVAYQLF